MVHLNPKYKKITLNVNNLNTPIETERVAEWNKMALLEVVFKKTHFRCNYMVE